MPKYAQPPPQVAFLPDLTGRPQSALEDTKFCRRRPVWRSRSEAGLLPLPPLARGASRHRSPSTGSRLKQPQVAVSATQALLFEQERLEELEEQKLAAETCGRKILGTEPWEENVFELADGAQCGYLLPAEFAALCARLGAELGQAVHNTKFRFSFVDADTDYDGRISLQEWKDYCEKILEAFGNWRCETAALRYLGTRAAEPRRKVGTVYMTDGYDHAATLRLLSVCSLWQSSTLIDNVRGALDAKADPNAGLTDSVLNDFTPLILLSKAYPTIDGRQIGLSIDELIAARADVHRESGKMEFGRLVPLRFAAQLQNEQVLEALLKHVCVGDTFLWAAGEDVSYIMEAEMQKKFGTETLALLGRRNFNMTATVLLRAFASPIVGTLTPEGAEKLLSGKFISAKLTRGDKANPNDSGLQGMTALMDMVKKGDLSTVKKLLEGRADTNVQDSSGATALHLASAGMHLPITRALLQAKARPDLVDCAGFSAWMMVGERCEEGGGDATTRRELLEQLKPRRTAAEVLEKLEKGESLINEVGSSPDKLAQGLRLHESIFFNPRVVERSAFEGRRPRDHLLKRAARLIVTLLKTDPLEGHQKAIAKYLLQATRGPTCTPCPHVRADFRWQVEDNRGMYRQFLMDAVGEMMSVFASECNEMRDEIEAAAAADPGGRCAGLIALPKDEVTVPEAWQVDPFWATVQQRQVLRCDPEWALGKRSGEDKGGDYTQGIRDSATCAMALLRLGSIRSVEEFSDHLQVEHMTMEALVAKGYAAYSSLCNEKFQSAIREVAERVANKEGFKMTPPGRPVPVKGLPRLLEKTREAREERGDLDWPGRPPEYLRFSYCFHILDTVRLSFICEGETLQEQVAACMRLVEAFQDCTVERDKVCLLRQKSGFAAGIAGSGGYADVKLLMYADLGTHKAFDNTEVPLQIVGEVQLILHGYMEVKKRMHLVYEVERGSFDH